MDTIKRVSRVSEDSWIAVMANLLPLWLMTSAVLVEGFPNPPLPVDVGIAAFYLIIPVGLVLLWKGWLAADLLAFSLTPILFGFALDEISTAYKTPFILVCALIMTIGMLAAQHSSTPTARWLILLFAAICVWVLVSHAAQGYWGMIGNMTFGDCFPYARGCPPLSGTEIPWWKLIFSL